ncbi:MAG: MFS transporter [Acidimicrobiales bacterium]|nr:MFS transporter [Acidimicrobiales bacterium]
MAIAPHDPPAAAPGLARVVWTAWPLLFSVLLLMVGSGLQGSLLGVRAEQAAFDSTVTGFVLGVYYVGYVLGSSWTPGLIRSVGHIRVFAALTSTASATVIVHGVWVSPVPWLTLRLVTGICVAGLFVVSESWLNDAATPTTRATLLGVYNTVVTVGLAAGTFLINAGNTAGVVLFVVGSVLLSMAAVPIALAPHDGPAPEASVRMSWAEVYRAAPLGLGGAIASGLTTGTAVGFGAVYASRAGFGVSGASQFVVSVLSGAIVGQIPLGNWSDRTDRRLVMGVAAVLVIAGSVVGTAATTMDSFPAVLVAGVLVGAGGFSLYGLSLAHLADYVEPETMIAGGARILTANGFGAAAGPILASVVMAIVGPEGFFELLALALAAFGFFVVLRMVKRQPVDDDHRSSFTAVPAGATSAVLDGIVSETVGVESAELRRRIRFARLTRPGKRKR